MYRIDVFAKNPKKGSGNKKQSSHWYQTLEEANAAKFALEHMPHKTYRFIPGENRKEKTVVLGGYRVSAPVLDNKY